jgi:glycogen debranching enzyme
VIRDRSLVRLQVRDDTRYVSYGSAVLATHRDGWLDAAPEQGFFVDQTRMLSRYRCLLGGRAPIPAGLSNIGQNSSLGYFIVGAPDGDYPEVPGSMEEASQHSIELKVSRVLGGGMHEDLDVANYSGRRVRLQLVLELEADFADQDETRGERQQKGDLVTQWRGDAGGRTLAFDYRAEHAYAHQGERGTATLRRGLELRIDNATSPPEWHGDRIVFELDLEARATWHACLRWTPIVDGERRPPPLECRAFGERQDDAGLPFMERATDVHAPGCGTLGAAAVAALRQARRDLVALRLPAFDHGAGWTPAAGLPMYVALFGRDTLTAAWEGALLGPEMMQGTLPELARWQGTECNDWRDEDPGRMLHEAHPGPLKVLEFNPKARYYGSITTSGFYPFVAAQLWHWTGDREAVAPYVEPALKALAWLDRGTDGSVFHRYRTRSTQGLANQAWKDSGDAIVHEDGRQVEAPIATCEEQGIVYAAKLNFAEVLWWLDRKDEAKRLFREAQELKQRFNEAFWMEDAGFVAMALDPQGAQVRSIGSNALHCVATGILDKSLVERTMARLFAPDMFSGWGVRTLSSEHPSYNPYAYHRGTVWPVEHGPFAVGAYRYGAHAQVERICRAQFEVASLFDFHRLPECISGHPRDRGHPFPALYPAANSPQAWSASTTFTLLQAMLGLQPFAPFRALFVDPWLPPWLPEIELRRLRVRDAVVDLRFFRKEDGSSDYEVLDRRGGALHVVRQPSPWSLTASFGERLKDLVLSALPGR